MSRLDDRLTTELERTARPADSAGVFERIDRRRARRASARRVRMGALAIIVVLGSVGGFLALNRAFRTSDRLGGDTSEGTIVFGTYPTPGMNGLPTGAVFSLYAVAPDGEQLRRLTGEGDSASSPTWSPDGSTIAFAPFSSGPDDPAWGIWTMDMDGSNVRQLIRTTGPVGDIDWSPDGSRLWFTMQRQPENGPVIENLMSVGADGQGLRSVIDDQDITGLSASPDGSSVAVSIDGVGGGLFVWDEAHGLQRVLPDTAFANSPAWSPDGSTIAFLGNDADHDKRLQQPQQLFLVHPDGSGLHQVTKGDAYLSGPSWAPAADRIIFGSNLSRFDQFGLLTEPAICRLESIRTDGTDRTTIFDGSERQLCIGKTAWQPSASEGSDLPSPTPTSTNGSQVDIGLGFPVCNVEYLRDDFDGNGTVDTAWTATKAPDEGPCPTFDGSFTVVAVDLTGDGIADGSAGPLAHCIVCHPFDSVDLDGDGVRELVVVEQSSSVTQYALFSIHPERAETGQALAPISVASPGDPDAGFPAGEPFSFWAGGDEGYASYVQCAGEPSTVRITQTSHPVEGPGADVRRIQHTELRLTDGRMHVVSRDDSSEPTSTPFGGWTGPACGIDFYP